MGKSRVPRHHLKLKTFLASYAGRTLTRPAKVNFSVDTPSPPVTQHSVPTPQHFHTSILHDF